jgi:cysteinyl-tRNA synthetase
LELLEIDKADVEPRATEHIEEMVKAIEILLDKGYAYRINSDIYFSVDKFKDYGKPGQNKEALLSGVRIEEDKRKKNALDFALWKGAKSNEPRWPSPWGEGRPGWHIECSVMSTKYLGQPFDIHGGGRDLIFPHHENEIAQAESLNNKSFARYWMHHGLLTINGQKMAKSLGNSLTIKKALSLYHPNTLKLFFLSSHYASPVDFTYEKMAEYDKAGRRIDIFYDRLHSCCTSIPENHREHLSPMVKYVRLNIKKAREEFEKAMDDDFNTPKALAILFDFLDYTSEFINFSQEDRILAFYFSDFLVSELCYCLGLTIRDKETEVDEDYIRRKISEREKARLRRDYRKADRIRKELEEKGIILEDTRDGHTIFRRK